MDAAGRDPEARERLSRRVQVVGGKGGVGRTTIACGLAWSLAAQGRRTLLLEVDAPDSAARRLGVEPARDDPREVYDRLWLCNMSPEGSLREYALMVLRFKALYRLVFENRVVRSLLRSIPSLGEFTMAGKFWFHTSETLADGRPKYDHVVLDAPATGHAITFLAVSRVVADLAPAGRMKDEATRMARMVESASTCLHIVSRPEEMPVNEALDLETQATSKVRIHPGVAVVNRFGPHLLGESDRSAVEALSGPWAQWSAVGRAVLERGAIARAELERYAATTALPIVTVPRLDVELEGRAAMEQLGSILMEGTCKTT